MGKNRKKSPALTIGVMMFLLGAIMMFIGLVSMAGKEQEAQPPLGSPAWKPGEQRPDVRTALLEEQVKALTKELEASQIKTAAAVDRLEAVRQSGDPLREKLDEFRMENDRLKAKLKTLREELTIEREKSARALEHSTAGQRSQAAPE